MLFLHRLHKSLASLKQVFDFVGKVTDKLPEAEKAKLGPLLSEIADPAKCWEIYLNVKNAAADVEAEKAIQEDEEDVQDDVVESSGKLGEVKANFNRPTGMLLDLLVRLMAGKFYQDCRLLASDGNSFLKAMPKTLNSEGEEQDDPCGLVKEMRLIVEHFDGSNKSVTLSGTAPMPSLLSQVSSQPGDDNQEIALERERQWKSIQAERRKYISFSAVRTWQKESILTAFRTCGKVYGHAGTLNSSHRLVVGSADLFKEEGDTPWSVHTKPGDAWKGVCDFASSVSGACDFTMLFDGRIREARRQHVPCR